MPLSTGSRLGPFLVVSSRGSGGMGEVCRSDRTGSGIPMRWFRSAPISRFRHLCDAFLEPRWIAPPGEQPERWDV